MKVVGIVQARMGSTRLPGKVLCDIAGQSMLARVIARLRRAKLVDELLIATTDSEIDDAVVAACQSLSVPAFRGQENDVLDRYYQAALSVGADAVVRVTSDCPLIDAEVTDQTVRTFLDRKVDYASNVLERRFPRGLDTEVMTIGALQRAWKHATQSYERAHVTPYIYEHPQLFTTGSFRCDHDYSHHRWTVDTQEDLQFVQAVYERLGRSGDFDWRDVLELLDKEPALAELNRGIGQKALHLG